MIEYYAGVTAATMTLTAFSLQIRRAISTKDTSALSYNLMIWVGSAMTLYFVFGFFYLEEPVVYVANAVGVGLNVFLIIFKLRNEKPK